MNAIDQLIKWLEEIQAGNQPSIPYNLHELVRLFHFSMGTEKSLDLLRQMNSQYNKPIDVLITIEDGVVQDVSANAAINYMLIDFDIEGVDEDMIVDIPQKRGKPQPAVVRDCATGPDDIDALTSLIRSSINKI